MKITRNLSLQLALATMIFAVLVAVVITGFQKHREHQDVLGAISKQFDQIEAVAVPALVASVWSINLDGVRLTAQGIANQPGVNFVAVTGLV